MHPWIRLATTTATAVLLGAAVPAAAAPLVMQSDMEIDWSSFTVTTASDSGPAPVFSWSNLSSTANGFTAAGVSAPDWTSPVSAHVGTASSYADSSLDATTLRASAFDSDGAGNSSGSINSLRQGTFSVIGNGTAEMTVNYSWHSYVNANPRAPVYSSFSYAYAALEAMSTCDPRYCGQRGGQIDIFPQLNSPPQFGSFSGSGKLVLDFNVLDGDQFAFSAWASATDNLVSPVPMPPSFWLSCFGLAGVLGRRQYVLRR